MIARCETEIVTPRGEACLVRQLPKLPWIAKIAEIEKQRAHRRDAEARRRSEQRDIGTARTAKHPQISADEHRSEIMQVQDGVALPSDPQCSMADFFTFRFGKC